jgi:DMSO/TMAO reductase YedYZ heme-binding membrane subunit
VLARRRHPAFAAAGTARPRRGRWILVAVLLAAGCAALAAGGTGKDRAILAGVQRLMLFYSGAFALIALTVAVAAGLVATDRLVMAPAGRVMSQAVHRALSLAAVGFLATHVVLEVLAHRSRPIDAVGPFLASGQRLYLGLGTLASDLVLLVLVTGVARARFAGWPAAWRAVHVTAYLAWPLAILHGLLAGRHAKPYVSWSYGGCLALVALALAIRLVATIRSRTEVIPHAVPDPGTHSTARGPRAGGRAAHLPRAGGRAADQAGALWPVQPAPPLPAWPAGAHPRRPQRAARPGGPPPPALPRGARPAALPGGARPAALPGGARPAALPGGTLPIAWPGSPGRGGIRRGAGP